VVVKESGTGKYVSYKAELSVSIFKVYGIHQTCNYKFGTLQASHA